MPKLFGLLLLIGIANAASVDLTIGVAPQPPTTCRLTGATATDNLTGASATDFLLCQ